MLDSRRNIALACALSALAGYVDAIGFLHLGGLFVSFMSGNSTRMGVSLAQGNWSNAATALGLVALFVVGAACGSLIVLGRGAHRQRFVLLTEALLLAIAALCYALATRTPRSRRSSWRWDWRMRCSRSTAAPALASLT
jgi:uncharacterized membrane protein YoaK (UPF0700 family)